MKGNEIMKNGNTINVFATIFLSLSLLTICPTVHAVSPAPDGGYPNGNTAEGQSALFSLTSGAWNTALGDQSLFHDTTGNQNTGIGYQTLFNTTTGSLSVATGSQTLFSNTTGSFNTANGFRALYSNTTGNNNTANGFEALAFNTTATENTADGSHALYSNTVGLQNTSDGAFALSSNTEGSDNTASGALALLSNTTGGANTADGAQALQSNTTGINNSAIGDTALFNNTTGSNNVALGISAGFAQTTGSGNVYIGVNVNGIAGESNSCYIDSIFGQAVDPASSTTVFVDANNKLGTMVSSKRFKSDIKPMDKASEELFSLKPVSFRYNKKIDPKGISEFGLVAEDVEKVNRDLVVHDKEGKPYSVRYDQVNAMLLNEFLKEHRKVQQLEANAAQQQKQIEALTAGLQKVSTQLDASKTATQVALNNR
jgi:hypothetical protein